MIKTFLHKFGIAWTSCMVVMVQGDISGLTTKHAIVASKTGFITGLLVVLMSLVKIQFKYKFPAFVFVGCLIADFVSHPSHFSGESFITAFVAALISYYGAMSKFSKKIEDQLK